MLNQFQLRFNSDGSVVLPTFILGSRNGYKLGIISNVSNINVSNSVEDAAQISFDVYKYDNGTIMYLWDDLNTFKLIYCPEFNCWFEATVEDNESDRGVMKHISLTELGSAELSQIRVYGLDINTEDSIIYDENYKPTVLYDENDPAHSLLHRIMSFAPHYNHYYVELPESVKSIQRTFSFNDQTVLECLQEVAEELSLFILPNVNEHDSEIQRGIYVADVLSTCDDCGYRGFFEGSCPNCGSHEITSGFGDDTSILVTADALGNDLTLSTNTDAIANCYHLQAGDDLMTAAVRQCNPNGTGYIWNFTNEMLQEMSPELSSTIADYNEDYKEYMESHVYVPSDASIITQTNALIEKYRELDEDFDIEPIDSIIGYPKLIQCFYEGLDFYYYLKTSLMPSESTDNITAQDVVNDLYDELAGTTVALGNTENLSLAAASTAVMNNARLIANSIYEVTIFTASLTGTTWTGQLMAKNFYNKDDSAITQQFSVTINDNYEAYVAGKVMKTLYNTTQGQSLVVAMYNQTLSQVQEALKLYSLDELNNINKAFNGVMEVISKFKGDDPESEIYTPIYLPTKDKLNAVQAELAVREGEVNFINQMVTSIEEMIENTQDELNFENYLGSSLWVELNSFRREANYSDNSYVSTTFRRKFSYSDSQFISDSLTNGEIIARAYEFLTQAEQKMAENNKYSYQLNSSLKNLMVIPEFTMLRDYFYCGSWIRIKTDDNELYKLRLISFEMSFDNPESLTVSFADISNTSNIREAQQIIAQSANLVKNQKKYSNQLSTKFTSITDDMQCDYVIKDSYTGGSTYDNVEILGDQMVTTFNVLDGLIQGKISADEAESLISQELNKITLSVENSVEGKYSIMKLSYDGVVISTSGQINLGGTVVFTDNLTDGTTTISGDNIKTGSIQSNNYHYTAGWYEMVNPTGNEDPSAQGWYEYDERNDDYYATEDTTVDDTKIYFSYESTGNIFSDSGSKFDLTTGDIQTPGMFVDGDGNASFKGTIMAEDGYIGGSKIMTYGGSDSGAALDFANTAWKLRSAVVDKATKERYYTFLTKNKHFYVINSETQGHNGDNDRSNECTIGSKNFPWGVGYFKKLRLTNKDGEESEYYHNVIPEGTSITLSSAQADWTQDPNTGIYYQTIEFDGLKTIANNQVVNCYPARGNANEFYRIRLFPYVSNTGYLTFLAEDIPSADLLVYILAEDYSSPEEALDGADLSAEFDNDTGLLTCKWTSPNTSSIFLDWQQDTLVIEKYNESTEQYEQVYSVVSTQANQYKTIPLVIGD